MNTAMYIEVKEEDAEILDQMLSDSNGATDAQKYSTFLAAAQKGSESLIGLYVGIHDTCDHLEQDKIKIIEDLVRDPKSFDSPLKSLDALTKHIDLTDGHFEKQSASFDKLVWKMYSEQSTHEVAQVGSRLMAEFLRAKLLQDPQYAPDFSFLNAAQKQDDLGKGFKEASLRDSVKVIQNYLVDYVASEGPSLPLNRGAAMLPVLASDVKPQTAVLWEQKITDFKETSGYSLKHGEVLKTSPVYEPTSM